MKGSCERPEYRPLGDQAVLVCFENRIDPAVTAAVLGLARLLQDAAPGWLADLVPSYRCLAVFYDPGRVGYREATGYVSGLVPDLEIGSLPPGRLFQLPTVYGGPEGPDLEDLAAHAGKPVDEVVRLFSGTEFVIFFLGFIGAQPYLGGLPETLAAPRRPTPRTHVAAGSVGVGGLQAGVVTIDQPSGYHFIGRTARRLYDPGRTPPSPFLPGDRLRFTVASGRGDAAGTWPAPIPEGADA